MRTDLRATHHELLPLNDREEWDGAVRRVPHGHAHTWGHVAAFQATTGDPTFLYVGRDSEGEPLVVCPIAERRLDDGVDAYTPFGFGGFAARGDVPHLASAWQSLAESRQWTTSYVALNPLLDHDLGFPAASFHPLHTTYLWDVTPRLESLLAAMSHGRRRQLREWEAAPRSLTWDSEEVLAFVQANGADFFRQRSASSAYSFKQATWEHLLRAGSVLSVGAAHSGRVLAVAVFGRAGNIADYLFGISLPGSQVMMAPLLWEGVKVLRATGIEVLNLGASLHADDGIALFKRQFGSERHTSQCLHLVHDEVRYASRCMARGLEPTQSGGFFPPYHQRAAG